MLLVECKSNRFVKIEPFSVGVGCVLRCWLANEEECCISDKRRSLLIINVPLINKELLRFNVPFVLLPAFDSFVAFEMNKSADF